MIRAANIKDIKYIAKLHISAMPKTPNSMMGVNFISDLYLKIHERADSFIYVSIGNSKIKGVISYSVSMPKISSELSKSIPISAKIRYILNLINEPCIFWNLIRHWLFMIKVKRYIKSKYASILTIVVDRKYQGKGIGTALIDEVMNKLPNKMPIYLDTYMNNRDALSFYKKNRFTIIFKSFDNVLLRRISR